ncbi:hypothetical protein GCM10022247_34480 [Allokutzneria multivorans]|uniref:Lipoprotein n=1 Tax=Allokutzneria multivorans TaxID=1142134 RepID=A0ABP7SC17_9PSEU
MRRFMIAVVVLVAGTACGSPPGEEIALAYPHAKLGTHSLADKECMVWNWKDKTAKTVKKEPGALCNENSRFTYTASTVVAWEDCRQKLSDGLKKSGVVEFGRYYCVGGAGYKAAFSAELVDDRVVVTHAVVDRWQPGG